jgi:hypothetical protein
MPVRSRKTEGDIPIKVKAPNVSTEYHFMDMFIGRMIESRQQIEGWETAVFIFFRSYERKE